MTITLMPPVAAGRRSRDELRDLAHRANTVLTSAPGGPASAERVVEWAASEFGERFCVTSSMADAVLAHVVSAVVPGIEVVFLDTGLHFPETLRRPHPAARTLPVRVATRPPH